MKATGVVRRIDDLGRVVIPKEIRKTLRIKERRSIRNIYRQRRGNNLKKIFSNWRTIRICNRICWNISKNNRAYCMYNR